MADQWGGLKMRNTITREDTLHHHRLGACYVWSAIRAAGRERGIAERVSQDYIDELLEESATLRAQGRIRSAARAEDEARSIATAWGL
jgi:hypothetical protein